MIKWQYWGMSCLFIAATPVCLVLAVLTDSLWVFVGLASPLTSLFFTRKFKTLHHAAPEE